MRAPGDQIVSYGGYTFDPNATVELDYPAAVRPIYSLIPTRDFSYDQYGTTRAPRKATQLTARYQVSKASSDLFKSELDAIFAACIEAGTSLLVTQQRDGSGSTSAWCTFVSFDRDVTSDDVIDTIITLIWIPLTDWAAAVWGEFIWAAAEWGV